MRVIALVIIGVWAALVHVPIVTTTLMVIVVVLRLVVIVFVIVVVVIMVLIAVLMVRSRHADKKTQRVTGRKQTVSLLWHHTH